MFHTLHPTETEYADLQVCYQSSLSLSGNMGYLDGNTAHSVGR